MNKKLLFKLKILAFIIIICFLIWFLGIRPIIVFNNNENKLNSAGKRYFEINSRDLPTGERVKSLSLTSLYNGGYIDEDFKNPYTGGYCSYDNSWVKVKKIDGEYKYFTYLDCGILKSFIDHDGPNIKLKGKSNITINVGDEYTDPGVYSIVDENDGNIEINDDNLVIKGNVDVNKIGTYKISYISFDSLKNKTIVYRTINVIDSLDKRMKDDLSDKLSYVGNPDNNYIMFSNMLFRIVGFTDKGDVKIVAAEDIANVNYSKIEKWLDEVFYNSLDDDYKKLIVETKFCNMSIVESNLSSFGECNLYTKKRLVYIPSIMDINSSSDENGYSFLRPETASWISNKSEDKKAYVVKELFYDKDNYGKNILSVDYNYNYGVRPLLVIKRGIKLLSGDGSLNNPYVVIKNKKINGGGKINTGKIGNYIMYNNIRWRIIGITDDGLTKIISNDNISCSTDKLKVTTDYSKNVLTYNPKKNGNIGYYINNQISKCFDASIFINHEIEVPIYKNKIIFGDEIETKKYTVKFSAPNMYDLFSARPNIYDEDKTFSYWLTNSSKAELMQGAIYDIGLPENEYISFYEKFGIRVVGYLKSDIVVVSGNGSYFKPYILK